MCVGGRGGGTRGVAQLSARWCTRSFAQTNTWICFLVVASSIFEHVCIYLTGFTLMVFQFITVSVFVTSGVEFELNRVHNAILYHSKQPINISSNNKRNISNLTYHRLRHKFLAGYYLYERFHGVHRPTTILRHWSFCGIWRSDVSEETACRLGR